MRNRVRQLRAQVGWIQAELGRYVGVSWQTIQAIETEKYEPSIWLAYDIARLFDRPIEAVFIFEGSERRTRSFSSRRKAGWL